VGYGDDATDRSGLATATEAQPETVPDHVSADLVYPLDHWNGAAFVEDPLSFWDGLRDDRRVFWSPFHGGFWCLTRYEDIHEAFQRPDLFSSRLTNIPGREVKLLPISLDPPDHTKYRRLLNQPFSPARIDVLIGTIAERCQALLDGLAGQNGCDFIDAFGKALPTSIFIDLLGLPPEEIEQFMAWNHTILHVHGDAEGQALQRQANEELSVYLSELVAVRKTARADDLISVLIPLEIDGRPLADEETIALAYLLFMAGLDTVTSAMGWSWKFLAEHPAHRQQIVDDPSLIPAAIEELLRFHSFVQDARTLSRDAVFAGVEMKAGDRIMLPTASADRDEDQFPDAMTVDFQRDPNRHIAFAAGPHRCVGSHLARAELRIAMTEWHARIPHYRLTPGAEVHIHGGAVVGLDQLPLDFVTG